MSGPGAVDEVVRRLEANLKAARRLRTPLGAVELGEHLYVRRNVGDAALQATLEARKGIVLKSSMQITIELAAVDEGDAERLKSLASKHEATSVSTHRWPRQASSMRTCRASCAARLGRNPKLQG